MEVLASIVEMQKKSEQWRLEGKRIGLVPTMGALHQGHTSLMKKARQQSDKLVTSVFVNPTQFGPDEDYAAYPRDLARDNEIAAEAGTDLLFAPEALAMYPDVFGTYVTVDRVSTILEGKFRPTHFRGVNTIVTKLFHITKPHVALFGQKDAQQAFILRKMARDLNFDLSLVTAPIIREDDGLAVSSRNVYLSSSERARATSLYQALQHARNQFTQGERSIRQVRREVESMLHKARPSQVDYVAFVEPETFTALDEIVSSSVLVLLAVRFGKTRLIDNELIDFSNEVKV